MGVILDAIGIEIEGLYGTRDEIHHFIMSTLGGTNYLSAIHKDASVETPVTMIRGVGLINLPHRFKKEIRNTTLGYEIVTNPLSLSDMEIFIPKVLIGLQRFGERFSPRTSIHIHVGFPESLSILKRGLKLGAMLDPLLFRLAGLGNPFRGEINSSIFCRPLSAAPFILGEDSGRKFQLNPLRGMDAKTMSDFWKGYFISYGNDYERYHPARYFAWNLYSVLLRGTLEFRYFNLCLNPEWILTMINLCQSITELAVTSDLPDIPVLDPFSEYKDSVYEDIIERLLSTIKNSDMLYKGILFRKETLLKILYSTPKPDFGKKKVLSHMQRAYPDRILERFSLESTKENIPNSGFINIHSANVADAAELLI